MSALDALLQRPQDLAAQIVPTLLDPNSGVLPTDLTLSTTEPGQTVVTPTVQAYTRPGWSYYGHAVATYDQVDLGIVLGNYEIRLLDTTPTTTGDLALQLAGIFNINLTREDVVDVPVPIITPGMIVVIQANPDSLMWKGQRAVRLFSMTIPYPETGA